jgi:hypothetical protein
MNRTLKETTVKRYHYDTHRQLKDHLAAPLNAYYFAKRLKPLQGLTPYEPICKAWADEPERFECDPSPPHLGTAQQCPNSEVCKRTCLKSCELRVRGTSRLLKIVKLRLVFCDVCDCGRKATDPDQRGERGIGCDFDTSSSLQTGSSGSSQKLWDANQIVGSCCKD